MACQRMKCIETQMGRLSIGLHPRRILGVIEFDEGAQDVLDCALQYAEMHGATVHFIHVVDRPSFLSGMREVLLAMSDEESAEEARIALLTFMDQADRRGLEAMPLVRSGRVEQEVIRAAKDLGSDLILVSTDAERRNRWGRSVAEKILRKAPCPVLALQKGVSRERRWFSEDWRAEVSEIVLLEEDDKPQ
jgi:nucleotide-binding universal stress UspA family protein